MTDPLQVAMLTKSIKDELTSTQQDLKNRFQMNVAMEVDWDSFKDANENAYKMLKNWAEIAGICYWSKKGFMDKYKDLVSEKVKAVTKFEFKHNNTLTGDAHSSFLKGNVFHLEFNYSTVSNSYNTYEQFIEAIARTLV